MKLIKNDEGEWHGHNSLPHAYAGAGFLLKPLYAEYNDKSGHYLTGFELFYYGAKVHNYLLPKEAHYSVEKQAEYMAILAQEIRNL